MPPVAQKAGPPPEPYGGAAPSVVATATGSPGADKSLDRDGVKEQANAGAIARAEADLAEAERATLGFGPKLEKGDAGQAKPMEAPGREARSCGTACAALQSMTRAAEHLCGLTGEGDARCTSARSRVKTAGDRVRGACPSCGT